MQVSGATTSSDSRSSALQLPLINRQLRGRFHLGQRDHGIYLLNAGHARQLIKEEALIGFDVPCDDPQQKVDCPQ